MPVSKVVGLLLGKFKQSSISFWGGIFIAFVDFLSPLEKRGDGSIYNSLVQLQV